MSIVALQGSLDSFKLPDVLTFFDSGRKTGMLTVSNDGREAYVFCRNGAVVYAASNQESLRLATLLLRKKRITRDQAETIDDLMLHSGGRFGDVAVKHGVLTESQLDEFLKIQVSEVLYDSFLWKNGTFAFYEGFDLPSDAVTISVDLANLIMEGARRISEWEECLQLLPDSEAVFRVITRPETEKITLTSEEWKVLFLINGVRTLEDLCRDSEEDPLTVYRVVYGLATNKLIEQVDRRQQGVTAAVADIADETMRQAFDDDFRDDSTVRETGDDTSLVVSADAKLAYKDVVRTTVAQLGIANGDLAGTVLLLTDAEYTLGRQSDNTIQITDLGISGHHARIFRGPEGYIIEDLKSRNGTWLNGTRVFHAVLQNNDDVRIGATDLKYQVLYDGATKASVA
jgi:uncharacterized protein DUF4388/FHA domain-containing protein